MKADNLLMLAVVSVIAWVMWTAFGPEGAPAAASVRLVDFRTALASGQPVLVDFYADWCGPCKMMKPVVHELAEELHGKVSVVQVNVDQNGDLAQQYGVRGIPCFVVIKGGKEVARQTGSMPKAMLRELIGR